MDRHYPKICESHSVVSDSWDPMDCGLPGTSVHGIFQARILKWVAIPYSKICKVCKWKIITWKDSQCHSVQFSSVAQSCPTLCNPMNRSMPGLPVHHQLLEFTQTHVHWVGDTIQPSHPLLSPFSPAHNLSQHQGLFQWVNSCGTLSLWKSVSSPCDANVDFGQWL